MPRDNRCMYMAHICFYVCCIDCVGSVGMFVLLRPLLKIVFLVLSVEVCCVMDVMGAVFSVCIMRCGAVGACVWEV